MVAAVSSVLLMAREGGVALAVTNASRAVRRAPANLKPATLSPEAEAALVAIISALPAMVALSSKESDR